MDAVFEEERSNLQKVEQKLTNEIQLHEQKSRQYVTELNEYEPGGGLGPTKADLRAMYKKEDALVELFTSFTDEPYFGRMDLDVSDADKTESYYIGKEGITINNSLVVVDWRSDVGQYFYMKTERNFVIREYHYQLALRRALDIKHGELLGYNTEFDNTDVSLEGDVMDPFLLTVLRDKRRQHRLTDIIKTIQGKQNDIIRKPRDEEFIVQGCAGSGKTMILLHRLSYLKFNNRELNWKNVKIITPNKAFEAHIDDLSSQLGLDEIERLSVDEYYARLIKAYSDKIKITAEVASEKILSSELLQNVYSLEFAQELRSSYHEYWEGLLKQLREERLSDLFAKYNVEYIDENIHSANTYSLLQSAIKRIVGIADESAAKYEELQTRIANYYKSLQEKSESVEKLELQLSHSAKEIREKLEKEFDSINVLLENAQTYVSNAENELKELKKQQKDKKREVDTIKQSLDTLKKNKSAYLSYDSLTKLVKRGDFLAQQVLDSNRESVYEVNKLAQEYSNTPIYKFMVRNQIHEKLDSKKKLLDAQIMVSLRELEKDINSSFSAANAELLSLDEVISSQEKKVKDSKAQADIILVKKGAISICIDAFQDNDISDLRQRLSEKQREMVANIINLYVDNVDTYYSLRKSIDSLKKGVTECQESLSNVQALLLSAEEMSIIESSRKIIDGLCLNSLLNATVMSKLKAQYKKYSVPYTKDNYRHKLYIKLLFCNLYYTKCPVFDNFVNIDEAQDLALSEYLLLKYILGNNCIFNLYGDINQLVYSYKGIDDWKQLRGIIDAKLYVLNENYRNTLQITEYCNKEFMSEVYPIGITGEDVEEQSIDDAISWLQSVKRNNAEYRCAIIYRYGRKGITDILKQKLSEVDISWFAVDDERISVVSVELAKGLEFEAVVVITDGMTINEKYIAFTRALSNLVVVREKFSDEMDVISGESTEEEELVDETDDTEDNNAWISDKYDYNQDEIIDVASVRNQEDNNSFVIDLLSEVFGETVELNSNQISILQNLDLRRHVACNAPSGNMKSLLFFAEVVKARKEGLGQSLITAEELLQENELVMAERFKLKVGRIGRDYNDFVKDVKREKYDLIFIPFEFFEEAENVTWLIRYFGKNIPLWAVDHISARPDIWSIIKSCGQDTNATFYLMSKEGFSDVDIEGYSLIDFEGANQNVEVVNVECETNDDKELWVVQHIEMFDGSGIIYCNDKDSCHRVSKLLKKKKIKAPEYVDTENVELMHYLTNGFTSGSIPILVTLHELGKNLSNSRMNFVVHYDIPQEEGMYEIHLNQLNGLSESKRLINLLGG